MNNAGNDVNQRPQSVEGDWEMDASDADTVLQAGPSTEPSFADESVLQQNKSKGPRNRSPTPPRALFRSTTGKGVAFTTQDRDFLISFMAHRKYVPLHIYLFDRCSDFMFPETGPKVVWIWFSSGKMCR